MIGCVPGLFELGLERARLERAASTEYLSMSRV